MTNRPKILLVPDYLHWATARIAKEIVLRNREYDFYILSKEQIEKRNSLIIDVEPLIDAVHWLVPGGFNLFSKLHSKLNLVSINHVVDWNPFAQCSNAEFLVTISSEWTDYLITKGIQKDKIIEFKITIDADKFKPVANKKELRKYYGIPTDAFVIGFFGKGSSNEFDRKGTNIFIQSMQALREYCPDLFVFISGPEQELLKRSLESINIKYCHKLFTSYSELSRAYNALDVYLITSKVEGGPLPLLESMSCAIPVITTPVGVAREIIKNDANGLLIPKDDPSAVVQSVIRLQNDPKLAIKIGDNGRRTILENQTENEFFRYSNQLREALSGNKTRPIQKLSPRTRSLLQSNFRILNQEKERYEWLSYRLTYEIAPKFIRNYRYCLSSFKKTFRALLPKRIWSFLKLVKRLTTS